MAPCYGWRSPHTRGARGQALRRLGPRRIIPAYAGSTGPPPAETQRRLHHPRIRGEHDVFADQVAQTKGSSPHTRGALRACQGVAGRVADHPRIRGEHPQIGGATLDRWQSSPHTRGAPGRRLALVLRVGIIPAYAGSTPSGTTRRGTSRDHPRIRGEHFPKSLDETAKSGSSPHTRGARSARASGWGSVADHPRIRGEHHRLGCAGDFGRGSSPHTRGAR